MRSTIAILSVLAAACAAGLDGFAEPERAPRADGARLPAAAFDPGGETFDMAGISARLYGGDGGEIRDYRPVLSVCHGMGPNVWPQALERFPIVVTARPMNFLDRRFAVSREQCGVVQFGWKKRREFRIAKGADLTFELRVPRGYRARGATFGDLASATAARQEDGSVLLRVPPVAGLLPGEFMNSRRTLGVLVEPEADAPEGALKLRVVGTADGKALSPWESVTLYTVPPVRARAVPKRYLNGMDTALHHWFRTPEAYRPLAKLLHEIGARLVIQDYRQKDFIPYWKTRDDHLLVAYTDDRLCDGYRVCNELDRPAGDRFVHDPENPKIKGRWYAPVIARSTCPMAIYEERPFFLEKIVPELADCVKGADAAFSNWEGSWYAGKGCYCASCRRAFAAFAKIPQTEVDAKWPHGFGKGECWYEIGCRFRSWQHGLMMKTLNRHLTRLTGPRSMGFIPAVSWTEMSDRWLTKNDPPEAKAIDYADEFQWMNPWGPYAYWYCPQPYRFRKCATMCCWYAADEIRRRTDADYPADRRPKLLGYPNGFQCGSYLATPEVLSMAMASFIFNRWEACSPYYFPNGCDARYLKVYAEAVELSARAEDFTLGGRPANADVTVTPVREFAVPCKKATAWLAGSTNVAVLQTAAFDLRGARLVGVLNFWRKAPAFFRLRNRGLAPGDYTLVENGTIYVKDPDRPYWTDAELAEGVDLAVGALRTAAFEIRPRAQGAADRARRVMAVSRIADEYRRRQPELAAKAAEDAAEEKREQNDPWSTRMNVAPKRKAVD